MTSPITNFRTRLLQSFSDHNDRPAIEVGGEIYTYGQLARKSAPVSSWLAENVKDDYVCILGSRSFDVYGAICGTVLADKAYVPLNPKFPAQRLLSVLQESPCQTLVVCPETTGVFEQLLGHLSGWQVMWLGQDDDLTRLEPEYPDIKFIAKPISGEFPNLNEDMSRPAYLLFTSGTTGKPKGVMITDGNLSAYLKGFNQQCQIQPDDRHSQFFELSFDVSVHDLFMTWVHGACLVVVPEKDLMAPAKFIKNHSISVWFSVPAAASMMQKFGMLKSDSFPSLRLSMFIGEALPESLIAPWQKSAPNSKVWNVYGPTEATIACLYYDCADLPEATYDVVPIGNPFGETQFQVSEDDELWVAGPQVCGGYLNNPEKTQDVFVEQNTGQIWYRTGDVVRLADGDFVEYHGRLDDQVQIRGFRVELSEIEGVIARAVGHNLVAVIVKNAQIIEAFVQGDDDQNVRLKVFKNCKEMLPDYMNPKKVTFMGQLPLNANGKIDRNVLKS